MARVVIPSALSVLLVVSLAASSLGDDESGEGMNMQDAMQRWIEAGTPGDAHQKLVRSIGDWTVVTTITMPGAPPMKSVGEAKIESVLGGRFTMERSTGSMMGREVEAIRMVGYDNLRKQYVIWQTDTTMTGSISGTGSVGQDGETMTFIFTMDEPMTGELGKHAKSIQRWKSDDHFVIEVYEIQYGDPFQVVELEYRRKKG